MVDVPLCAPAVTKIMLMSNTPRVSEIAFDKRLFLFMDSSEVTGCQLQTSKRHLKRAIRNKDTGSNRYLNERLSYLIHAFIVPILLWIAVSENSRNLRIEKFEQL